MCAKQYGIVGNTEMASKKLILDGEHLTIENLVSFVRDDSLIVEVSTETLERVSRAHEFLKAESTKRVIYGVNTGFGPMVSRLIGKNQLVDLQYNLVRSHATGIGEPILQAFSLVAMVVRLNTFLQGHSGVSEDLIKQFKEEHKKKEQIIKQRLNNFKNIKEDGYFYWKKGEKEYLK